MDFLFRLWKTLRFMHSKGYTAINSKVSMSGSSPGRYIIDDSFTGRILSVARTSFEGVRPGSAV